MTNENTPAIEDDLPEQLRIRREKRASLIERGIEPYPVSVARTKSLKEVREKYTGLDIDVATGDIESLTGRIIFKRDTGKLCFATLRDCGTVTPMKISPLSLRIAKKMIGANISKMLLNHLDCILYFRF